MNNYYYLVAGLPEINLDDAKLSVGYVEYVDELMQALAKEDAALLRYFRMTYENRNLLTWLKDKEAELHPLGMLSAEDFNEQWQLLDYEDKAPLEGVPAYFLIFMRDLRDSKIPAGQEEQYLTAMFYEYTQQAPNAFVRRWFEFQWHLNNVQIALNCRKYGMDIETQVVGDNEVTHALRSSSARDFNLNGIFPAIETLMRMNDESDLLRKEKQIDRIQWEFLDELCTGYYFSIEVLLAYLIKLQSVERWLKLDAKQGEEIFRHLILSMKEGAQLK
jgi:hypothetical protein